MAIEKVEYSFPHENEEKDIEIESSSAVEVDLNPKKEKEEVKVEVEQPKEKEVEIEVVDDTPKADRNRKPSKPPEDVTDEELEQYSEKVRKRIQHFSKGYHDERRAKEASLRESQELERLTKRLMEENDRLNLENLKLKEENDKLKGDLNKNQEALLKQAQQSVDTELLNAKEAYKKAYEAGDTDAVLAAQEALTQNKIKADKLKDIKIPSLQEKDSDVQQNVDTAPTAPKVDDKALEWSKKILGLAQMTR